MENNYAVRLDNCDKIKAIKIYRSITNSDLVEAKKIIDSIPDIIIDNLTFDEANKIVIKFQEEQCPATVIIKSHKIFSETSSSDHILKYNNLTSGKELLSVLKQIKDIILKSEQFNIERKDANKLVDDLYKKCDEIKETSKAAAIIGIFIGIVLGSYIGNVIGAIIGAIGGVIVSSMYGQINKEKRAYMAKQYYDEHYPILDKKRKELQEMSSVFLKSDYYIKARSIIPSEYFNLVAVEYITKMIENRRADSIKEAINLYEDYLHKNRLEEIQRQQTIATQELINSQKQMAEAIESQTNVMREIDRNTR